LPKGLALRWQQKDSFLIKALALASALGGGLILAYVFVPILAYEFAAPTRFDNFLSPIPSQTAPAFADYTKASNWFVGGAESQDFSQESGVKYYTLSIPALRIEDATVAIGGEDLAESLIQYPGTALPGKRGNTVIFGHSILPQFYNPKSYLSIFSKLPTLKKGDEITVSYDGATYLYRVEDLFEVYPTDIQVLEQDQSDSFLTLVTCVPPGHPLKPKRLIVRARVVPL
jgi:sortase A